ncbi:dUTP diphosphatase [Mycobacterium sp. 663a-19]|uniref:dUTP diphosphatase n=1 Tax=Mycobacterium sp. 663a-19 TaxID=2986148 RepID=UPI002D1F1473|nr:dUTP diphosphatase [Mycobacterium sp. 663a-19]MEB3983220.1 dUTP diphosphatase [Mycobacterium sp. 663a-19]
MSTSLAVVRLDPELPLPSRAHDGDAGVDLYSAEDVKLEPGQRALVRTGVAVAVPHGMVGLVHPRSGLAARVGLSIVNSPGTIDAGYRGEIKVALINLDPGEPIVVHRGDRIAQLLVQRVELVELVEVSSFDEAGLAETTRGHGGHGSSGGHASL